MTAIPTTYDCGQLNPHPHILKDLVFQYLVIYNKYNDKF
jgi:hypothetical protein